jgi:hypothetical protein
MRSPQRDYWREAIAKELAGLLALETWEMVPASSMPPGANLMHCHYVFAVKRKADGSIEKFKARLVADGNTQKHGVDFDRVFATVVKTSTILSGLDSPSGPDCRRHRRRCRYRRRWSGSSGRRRRGRGAGNVRDTGRRAVTGGGRGGGRRAVTFQGRVVRQAP